MKNKKNSLIIRPCEETQNKNPSVTVSGIIPLIPLLAGIAFSCCKIFPSAAISGWMLFAVMALLGAVFLLLFGTKLQHFLLPCGIMLTIASCLLLGDSVLSSFGLLINDILDGITAASGRIHLHLEAGENALPAILVLGTAISLLCSYSAATGNMIPIFPLIALIFAAAAAGMLQLGIPCGLIFAGVLLLAGYGKHLSVSAELNRLTALAMCIVIAVSMLSVFENIPQENWKKDLRQKLHKIIYDSDTNSMPEGELSDLGPWNKSDSAALRLTMSTPQKMYLRGTVYDVYTGTAWEAADTQEIAEFSDLFYWLHENDFYGQAQIGTAQMLGENIQTAKMTVENISACSGRSYLPYAYLNTSGLLDERLIGDAETESGIVSVEYTAGSLPEWYALQRELSANQKQEAVSEYLKLEQAYEEYISSVDLQLTKESWNVLARQLGTEQQEYSLAEIQTKIREFLDEKMVYNETVYTMNGKEDFLHYVLERSGAGYSVQYATTAVLMLRYYGVPARYVEGYYLSVEDAEKINAGEKFVLTEEHAHAWAEVYLSGVGFVPFEVTPGYIDYEELALCGTNAASQEDGMTYMQNPQAYTITPQPEETEEDNTAKEKIGGFRDKLLWILLLVFLLVLGYVAVRKLQLDIALKKIDKAEPRQAVQMRYQYAMLLHKRCKTELAEDKAALELYLTAVYGKSPMTEDHRKYMDTYAKTVRKACHKEWNILKHIYYRLIECID